LSAVITIVILSRKTFHLKRVVATESGAPLQRSGKKKDRTKWGESLRARDSWIVPYGVPAALATWIVVGLQWAGFVLDWPPIH
jgi:hypothetical protein